MSLSTEQVATIKNLGLAATVVTKWLCASVIFLMHFPLYKSHTLKLLSSEHEYKNFPEWCNARPLTQLSCPINVVKHCPFWQFQILIVLSLDPDAKKV